MVSSKNQDSFAFAFFRKKKVVTIQELINVLKKSIATVRRRLKKWKAFTSYNQNGRYYALPEIPKFNSFGLWKYRKVLF